MAGVDDVDEPWLARFTIAVGKPLLWLRDLVERWLWRAMRKDFVVREWLVVLDRVVWCVWPVDAWVVEALPCRRTPRFVSRPGAEWAWLPAWELCAPLWAVTLALDAELCPATP